MKARATGIAIAALWALVARAAAAPEQAGTQPAATRPSPATSQSVASSLPTVNYADAAFGFELQLPAGWEYDRTRFQQYKDSIGLLRGRAPGGQKALQIVIFRIAPVLGTRSNEGEAAPVRIPAFEDWAMEFGREIAESAGATRVEWEPWSLPPRAGALLSYDSKIGATRTRTHTVCVPFDPSTVWVLVYTGAVEAKEDERRLREEFDQIAGSLRVHYDPGELEQMAAAFQRGEELLERLRREASRVSLDGVDYYYDIVLAGKPIGYLARRITREDHPLTSPGARHQVAATGIRVRERCWRFAEDGTARFTRLDLFSSFDLKTGLIEHEQIHLPAPDVPSQRPLVKTDQAIRKDDVLLPSYRTSLDVGLPEPQKPMSVGPVYLDLAWTRVLPALLLDAAQQTHAFVIYNTETRALISELITPLGERAAEGHDGPTYAFEVRDGLIDRPSLLYTDGRGVLLRLVAGDLVVRRVSREYVEETYGARRAAARQRLGAVDDEVR